ncbi:hypothetical protein [Nocardia jiangsuensis]|uniref:Plasmid replication, integration and excision activator n=1 Tax=Nocardia jiangsuensis TaxID=1691563 RepID=A0ABV8E241_9NOCA
MWFTPAFEQAFPKGLFLLGDIEPVTEFSSDRNAPKVQRLDLDREGNGSGKRLWRGTVTDPTAANAKTASFDVTFVADVMPVPAAPEIVPGMRPIKLEGLQIKPKIEGNGEFKRIGWNIRAAGIEGDTNAPRANGNGSAAKAVA